MVVEEIMQFMDENEHTLSENPFARKAGVVIDEKAEKKEAKTIIQDQEPKLRLLLVERLELNLL